jgi:homoserine kinase
VNKSSTAFAPATVANVAVGFDILGFALKGLGETATVEKIRQPTVVVTPVAGFSDLPVDPLKNTASAGLVRLREDKKLSFGFKVTLQKEIPIGSGLGGSAASAVAAIVAANALLPKKLSRAELLEYALVGEMASSGSRQGDNVGPCLEGGLVFVRSYPELELVKIKTPPNLRCVIALPKLSVKTREARGILQPNVALKTAVQQTANLTGFLLGLAHKDMSLIARSLNDAMIEPQRASLIPCLPHLKEAAYQAGALGCSISGSGPAVFALADGEAAAKRVLKLWKTTAEVHDFTLIKTWISPLSNPGASVRKK